MPLLRLLCLLALACALPAAGWAAETKDQRYGPASAQLADVHLPAASSATPGLAPILVLVHGGSWLHGDKAEPDFIQGKLARWQPLGFVVVSVNTRLLPDAGPREQAEDLGLALAWIQRQAADWRADPARILIMGHSSGGHLQALLAADARCASAPAPGPGWPTSSWTARPSTCRASWLPSTRRSMTRHSATIRPIGALPRPPRN
ncbi:alpha/beta hydrolase [Achromobacter insuavis]